MSQNPKRVHPRLKLIEGSEISEGPTFRSDPDQAAKGGGNWAILPSDILLQILESLLVFTYFLEDNQDAEDMSYKAPTPSFKLTVIHCISRLDAFRCPKARPIDGQREMSLFHRFHVGKTRTSLANTEHPQVLLNVLGVCKRWLQFGSVLFYSRNVFAFSSLGE